MHRESLTRPAPALVISTIFILDIETLRTDFVVDLVAAVHLDVRVYNCHHLLMNKIKSVKSSSTKKKDITKLL